MKVSLDFSGLKEIQQLLQSLASDSEINKTNKKIFQRAVDYSKPIMEQHMPRSENNARSGKKGYKPPGHAADNIPTEATVKSGTVGWTLLGDAQNWFYMKFVEWGTENPEKKGRDFILNTTKESYDQWDKIADQEYQKLLNEKLGD